MTDETATLQPERNRMLLARMAEAVYWAGRYLERAECTARIVATHGDTHVDLPVGHDAGWGPLLAVTGTDDDFGDRDHTETAVCRFLITDTDSPSSIRTSLTMMRENLRTARALVPREAWECANRLWLLAADDPGLADDRTRRTELLRQVIAGSHQLSGIFDATMPRDGAYGFWMLGRWIERADMTSRVLDVSAASLLREDQTGDDGRSFGEIRWLAALGSLAARDAYRRTMRHEVEGATTLRFLLLDQRFPRSVAHCLTEIGIELKELSHHDAALDACDEARHVISAAPLEALAETGDLHATVDELQQSLDHLHACLVTTYFSPHYAKSA